MEKKENKETLNRVIIGGLMILLIALLGYMLYNNTELKKSKAFLEDEKVKITQDLDDMIAKYDEAINENSSLSEELRMEREDIVLFRDSVANLKKTNYNIIRRYRNKIKSLEKSNQELFMANDSLRISNQFLTSKIDSAQVFITTQTAVLDSITAENVELLEKVGEGAKLQVNSVKVLPMRERSNGKLVSTSRGKRTDALRISFTIAENALANNGEENALIQVINPKGEIINVKGEETLENGDVISYTDKTTVEYNKANIDVISLIEVDRKQMSKGIYNTKVFLNGRMVGYAVFTLK